jgi:hypothetical protein
VFPAGQIKLYKQHIIRSDHEPRDGGWGWGRRQDVHTECLPPAQRFGLTRHGLRTVNFSKLMNLLNSYTKSKRQENILIPRQKKLFLIKFHLLSLTERHRVKKKSFKVAWRGLSALQLFLELIVPYP